MEVEQDLTEMLLDVSEHIHSKRFKAFVTNMISSLNEDELLKLVSAGLYDEIYCRTK
jgi:hypothetical protein